MTETKETKETRATKENKAKLRAIKRYVEYLQARERLLRCMPWWYETNELAYVTAVLRDINAYKKSSVWLFDYIMGELTTEEYADIKGISISHANRVRMKACNEFIKMVSSSEELHLIAFPFKELDLKVLIEG